MIINKRSKILLAIKIYISWNSPKISLWKTRMKCCAAVGEKSSRDSSKSGLEVYYVATPDGKPLAGGRIGVLKEQGQIEGLTSHSQQKRGSAHTRLTPTCSLESKSCFGFVNRNLARASYLRLHLSSFFKYFGTKSFSWSSFICTVQFWFLKKYWSECRKICHSLPEKLWICFSYFIVASRIFNYYLQLSNYLLIFSRRKFEL